MPRKRPQDQAAKPFKKYSTSRIDKEFTLIDKNERIATADKLIRELERENEAYYRGKEVPFEDNSSYMQCIGNPAMPNSFITVQVVSGSPGNDM